MSSLVHVACSSSATGSGISDSLAEASVECFPVERFDRAVASYMDMSVVERDSVCRRYAPVINVMALIEGLESADSVMAVLAVSAPVNVFQPDVECRLGDLSGFENALGAMRCNMPASFGGMTFPARVFGIVTPYSQSVVIADTIVLIGLNHYLGSDYEGYAGFADYMRRLKTPERMPYDFAEALIYTQYPFNAPEGTHALARIVYEGAVAKAVEASVAGATAASALGYTAGQMKWLDENESRMWEKMISGGLLFSIDPGIGERLVAPAPVTSIINREAPGRAGRYVGYKIVDSYMRSHPDIPLENLLQPAFYCSESVLVDAGYRP